MNSDSFSTLEGPPAQAVSASESAAGEMAPAVARRLRAGAAWVTFGRGLGIAANVLIGAVLARLLSPAEAGAFVVALNVVMFGGTLGAFGLSGAVVRYISERLAHGDRSGARRVVMLALSVASISAISAALLLALALWSGAAAWLNLAGTPQVLLLISLAIAIWSGQQLAAECLRGYHELRFASFFSGGAAGGPLANALFLALLLGAASLMHVDFTLTLTCLVLTLAFTFPLAGLLLWRTVRRASAPVEGGIAGSQALSLGGLFRVSLPFLALQVLAFVTMWADLWMAGVFCESEQVALYGFARRLAALIALPTQLGMLTVLSTIPDLHARGRLQELQSLLRKTALTAALPTMAAAAALMIAPGPILGLYYAPFYQQAAVPLAILALGQMCVALFGLGGYTLVMTGRQNAALLVNLGTALFVLVAAPLAARHVGILGLAVVSAAAFALQTGMEWFLARRLVGVWTHVGLGAPKP